MINETSFGKPLYNRSITPNAFDPYQKLPGIVGYVRNYIFLIVVKDGQIFLIKNNRFAAEVSSI